MGGIEFDDREMRRRLERLRVETPRAIAGAFAFQADRSTAYMKSAASWTDRTSAARNSLHALAAREGGRFSLVLAHGVSYGIWLEVANSGKYAIVLPALRQAASELQHMINGLWRQI